MRHEYNPVGQYNPLFEIWLKKISHAASTQFLNRVYLKTKLEDSVCGNFESLKGGMVRAAPSSSVSKVFQFR